MVHHAKVDWWVAALLGGLALLEGVAGVAVLVAGLVMEAAEPVHNPFARPPGPVIVERSTGESAGSAEWRRCGWTCRV